MFLGAICGPYGGMRMSVNASIIGIADDGLPLHGNARRAKYLARGI